MNYSFLVKIIQLLYILGLINLLNIDNNSNILINCNQLSGILLDNNVIKNLIIVNILLYIVLTFDNVFIKIFAKFKNKWNSMNWEIEFIIITTILVINLLIISNDFIILYLSLEIYSYSLYLLILIKETKYTSRMSILYLLLGSITSYFILLGLFLIYYSTGITNITDLYTFVLFNKLSEFETTLIIGLITIIFSLIYKLGSFPFSHIILRVYKVIDNRVLLYQLILPKFIFITILVKFYTLIKDIDNQGYFKTILYIIIIMSLIISSIAALFHSSFNLLITYSSLLNLGFILLAFLIYDENNSYNYYEFLLLYSINTIALFYLLYLNPATLLFQSKPTLKTTNSMNLSVGSQSNSKSNNTTPQYASVGSNSYKIIMIILVFSFIGIPPMSGFIIKINLIYSYIVANNYLLTYIIISIILLSTLISVSLYLKFLMATENTVFLNKSLLSFSPFSLSYLITFFTILILFYPIISYYLYPLLPVSLPKTSSFLYN